MGTTASITLVFGREKHARWAMHVAEGVIKACDVWDDEDRNERWGRHGSLMSLYLANEEGLKAYDCPGKWAADALESMQRCRTRVMIERCAELQSWFALRADSLDEFVFPQICLAYATRFPQVPFAAYCHCEQTTSGAVELTRASWNGERMRFRRLVGERPLDEDAWDTWQMLDLRPDGGDWKGVGDVSPLERHFRALLDEAEEARLAGDALGALHLADAAQALPGCAGRIEPVVLRGIAGRHLERAGVRGIVELWTRDVPVDVAERLRASEPVGGDVLLGEGRFVLRPGDAGFSVVDTRDGSVAAKTQGGWNREPTHVADDFRVLSGGRFFLIDWEYAL